MDEDDIEFTHELVSKWQAEVQEVRKALFGSIRVLPPRSSVSSGMTQTEMSGYLNDMFYNWRGVTPQEE